MHIEFLGEDEGVIRTLAQWHQGEWSHLSDRTVEDRIAEFAEHLETASMPLTVVAWEDGHPIGSASLLKEDLDFRPDLTPWLASVFTSPDHRQAGVGGALCLRIMEEARRLGVRRFYLFTPDRVTFYQRLGWQVLEKAEIRGEMETIMFVDLED